MLTDNLCQWIDKCVRSFTLIFFRGMSCTPVDRCRVPHPVSCSVGGSGSGVRGFVVLGICGARVRSSVCRTTLTVSTRLKGADSQEGLRLCGNDTFHICRRWWNPLQGTTWCMISPLLTTDEAVRLQDGGQALERRQSVAGKRVMFFQFLHNDLFAKHW